MQPSASTGKFRRSEERNAYLDTIPTSSSSSSSFHSAKEPKPEWEPAVSAASQRRAQYVDAVNDRWSQQVQQQASADTEEAESAVSPHMTTAATTSGNARALFLEDDSLYSPQSQREQKPPTQPSASSPSVSDVLVALSRSEQQIAQLKRASAAHEAQLAKTLAQYKDELTREREDRAKAERDLADVLFQSQQVSAQVSREQNELPSSQTKLAGPQNTTSATEKAAVSSDILWEKMREREERARQRVRKEFIEQAQDRLAKEQRRREEAELSAADALRRADQAETGQLAAEEHAQRAREQLEAAKAELHERYLLIEELRAQLARRDRQLEQLSQQSQRDADKYTTTVQAAEKLADQRGAALDAQRDFTERLRRELGIKEIDLVNKDSLYEDVLARVSDLQNSAAQDQARLDRQLQDMEDTYELRSTEQQMELQSLRRRCEELQRRCDASQAISKADLQRLQDAAQCAQEERDRAQGQLLELRVENKSLRLQLEKLTSYAKRLSADKLDANEQHRAEREALLRRYESENKALKAQLASAQDALKHESETHIQHVLELSEQLTRFRSENTRMSHHINALNHDRGEATRRLSVAQEAVDKLHYERAHLSHSLAYLRDRSYQDDGVEDDVVRAVPPEQPLALPQKPSSSRGRPSGGGVFDEDSFVLTPTQVSRATRFSAGPRPSGGSPTPRRTARALSILTEGTLPSPTRRGGPEGGVRRSTAAPPPPPATHASPIASGVEDEQASRTSRRAGSISSQFRTPSLQPSVATAMTTHGGQSEMPRGSEGQQPAPIPLPRRSPMRTRYSGEKNIGTMGSASALQSRTNSPRRAVMDRSDAAVTEAPDLFQNIELVRSRGAEPQGIDFLWRAGPPAGSEQAPALSDVGKLSTPPRDIRNSRRRRPSEDHFA